MATDVKNDASLGASLVAYYELADATDSTTNANDGTNDGCEFETGGIQGNKATFVLANTDEIVLPTLTKSANWSMSAWIKPTAWGAYGIVMSTGGSNLYWGIFTQAGAAMQLYQSNDVDGFQSASFTGGDFTFSSTNYPNSAWTHIVGTGDGTNFNFYRNGVAHGTPVAITKANAGSQALHIGQLGATSNYYPGGMDEIGIWSKALTADDVTALYAAGAGIPYDAGGGATPASTLSLMGVG